MINLFKRVTPGACDEAVGDNLQLVIYLKANGMTLTFTVVNWDRQTVSDPYAKFRNWFTLDDTPCFEFTMHDGGVTGIPRNAILYYKIGAVK